MTDDDNVKPDLTIIWVILVIIIFSLALLDASSMMESSRKAHTDKGETLVQWDEAIYKCSNCSWNGKVGLMHVIQESLNSRGAFKNLYYCPICGTPLNINENGWVWVDANNTFVEHY
jgi:hypothetical protein